MDRRAQSPAQNPSQDRNQAPSSSRKSGRAILVRVYWMFLGYIPIVACIAALLDSKSSPSWADLAFWVSVVVILLARLVDVLRLEGRTAEGDPATLAHWMRHAAVLIGVALLAWGAVRLV